MFLFPIGFFYACFMVASKRIAAKQRKENTVSQKKTLVKLRDEFLSPSQKGNDLSPQ